jgi:hypothetical protein
MITIFSITISAQKANDHGFRTEIESEFHFKHHIPRKHNSQTNKHSLKCRFRSVILAVDPSQTWPITSYSASNQGLTQIIKTASSEAKGRERGAVLSAS